MEKQKLGETFIKGSEIKRIIERGPDAMLMDIKSYVKRMRDLYKENIPVQLMGLKVHLIIDAEDVPAFFDAAFGCTEPAATEEEAEQKFKEMEL